MDRSVVRGIIQCGLWAAVEAIGRAIFPQLCPVGIWVGESVEDEGWECKGELEEEEGDDELRLSPFPRNQKHGLVL